MALALIQPLTEMSSRNISWGCRRVVRRADNLQYLVVFTQVAAGCQPATTWVNTTRYCKYSQVLLIMGENIARNM